MTGGRGTSPYESYDMAPVFAWMLAGDYRSVSGGRPAVRTVPDLAEKMDLYARAIPKASREVRNVSPHTQLYELRIDPFGVGYYHMWWNVDAAAAVIRRMGKATDLIRVSDLLPGVFDVSEENPVVPGAVDHPVIVGGLPICQPPLAIIEGNHRIATAAARGDEGVVGYYLTDDEHMPAMLSDLHRTLYSVHWNCVMMVEWMVVPSFQMPALRPVRAV